MDKAGLTARAAADQLGHAKVSMTFDHYYGRSVIATGAAGSCRRWPGVCVSRGQTCG
jgi:hypothetical protein